MFNRNLPPLTGKNLPRSSIVDADGSPLLLDDVPGSRSFGWGDVNLQSATPETRAILAETLGDTSNISLGAEGFSTSVRGLKGFLRNQAVGLTAGQLLMPIFSWLDETTGDPWTSRSIQGVLAAYGLVAAGDPFGVIAAPICWGIQEYMRQRQRLLETDDPEAERGHKFGYVREGSKWYPAIQTSKEHDEGWMGSNKTQVTFQYGENIKWRKQKGSTEWIPYFEKGSYHMKNFHVWDNEVDKPEAEAGEKYQKRVDPLRDFYYLSDAETEAYLQGIAGGSAAESTDKDHTFTDEEQASIQSAGCFREFWGQR